MKLPPLFDGPRVHRLVRTFPERIVVTNTTIGWNKCAKCKREHRVWMTENKIWRRLPRWWRKERLCTRCFRKLVWST